MHEHSNSSIYPPLLERKRSADASEKSPIKGVLKGGDVPPISKKYMRIEDALISKAWPDSFGSVSVQEV